MTVLGTLGDLVEDIVVWQREPVRRATDTDVVLHRARGGSAANVAALAADEYPTRFIGCVGEDAVGETVVADLRANGVDVRVQQRGTTGAIIVLVEPDGERTMLPDRGAAAELRDVPSSWLKDLAHLHVPAYAFMEAPTSETAASCLDIVQRNGATTSIDASSTGAVERYGVDVFIDLLNEVQPDYLFANRAEGRLLGLCDGSRSGSALTAMRDATILIKDGDRPTTVLRPDREAEIVPVPEVDEIRDLTGAGDAFAAGFLASLLVRGDPRQGCVAGHALAATVLRTPGASRANQPAAPPSDNLEHSDPPVYRHT